MSKHHLTIRHCLHMIRTLIIIRARTNTQSQSFSHSFVLIHVIFIKAYRNFESFAMCIRIWFHSDMKGGWIETFTTHRNRKEQHQLKNNRIECSGATTKTSRDSYANFSVYGIHLIRLLLFFFTSNETWENELWVSNTMRDNYCT